MFISIWRGYLQIEPFIYVWMTEKVKLCPRKIKCATLQMNMKKKILCKQFLSIFFRAVLENNRPSSMLNDYSWDLLCSHWTRQRTFLPQALLNLESTEWHAYVGRMAVLVKVRAWQINFPPLPYQLCVTLLTWVIPFNVIKYLHPQDFIGYLFIFLAWRNAVINFTFLLKSAVKIYSVWRSLVDLVQNLRLSTINSINTHKMIYTILSSHGIDQ